MAGSGAISSSPTAAATGTLNVEKVVYGDVQLKPRYSSFYREELLSSKPPIPELYVCPTCFKYTEDVPSYLTHRDVCEYKDCPPGDIIYDSSPTNIYEVDGEDHPVRRNFPKLGSVQRRANSRRCL